MIRSALMIPAHLQWDANVTRRHNAEGTGNSCGKNRRFRGDKPADNDDNRDKLCRRNSR
jgi:hypothetical protein